MLLYQKKSSLEEEDSIRSKSYQSEYSKSRNDSTVVALNIRLQLLMWDQQPVVPELTLQK